MWKNLGLVFVWIAVVVAGKGGSQEENGPPLHVDEFRSELESLQKTAYSAANRIDQVLKHAIQAVMDHTGNSWEGFEENFVSMMDEVGEKFDQETERMENLINRFWENPGDFKKTRVCNNVVSLYENKDQSTNLLDDFVMAMIADIGCFYEEFRSAEQIPVEYMVSGFSEMDAIQVIQGTFEKMYFIKQAGSDFGKAMEAMNQELNGGGKAATADKRTIERLIRMLQTLNKRK